MKTGRIVNWGLAAILAAGLAVSLLAQDAGTDPSQDSASSLISRPAQSSVQKSALYQAVRLSSVEGQVRITQSGGQQLTDQAVANTPLFDGYGIQTGDDGRAELEFPGGGIARIPPDSSVTLSMSQRGPGSVIVDNGMAYFNLHGGEHVRFADYTAFALVPVTLRVKLDEAPGELAVFDGEAQLHGPGGLTARLHGGESVKLAPQSGALSVAESIEPDSWDAWNSDRGQALQAAGGSAAPNGMPDSANPAWGDLNQNGNWYDVPDQGYVWSPYEASDSSWDPYGSGYWLNSPSYGYTWVSGESWGYLPYQCGLWNWYSGFGWGWAPGACTPWWGGGGAWGWNVGNGPGGWRPPLRPPRPRGPGLPRPGGGVHAVGPHPVIPVHRLVPPVETGLPLRDRRTPVTIAGATVAPMRPVAVRPIYNHQPARPPVQFSGGPTTGGGTPGSSYRSGYTSSSSQSTETQASSFRYTFTPHPGTETQGSGNRPGYTPIPGQNPVQPRSGYTPPPPSFGSSHARPAPSSPRPVPAPAPRAAPPPPAAPRSAPHK